jgi:hypothetical protein
MANPRVPRNLNRDRHGRGIRRPLLSKLFKHGQTRSHSFEQYVSTAMDYLKGLWSEELKGVRWKVIDAPNLSEYSSEVPRWRVDAEKKLIVIYRIPTERFGSHSRSAAIDERIKVEEQVFEAVAELIEIDPWDLVPGYYRR